LSEALASIKQCYFLFTYRNDKNDDDDHDADGLNTGVRVVKKVRASSTAKQYGKCQSIGDLLEGIG
jgi:hypothetical protein